MFHFLINRLNKIPLSEENYKMELDNIIHIAIENGYSKHIIENILRKRERKELMGDNQKKPNNTIKWCTLPYIGEATEKVGRILQKNNYRIAYKSNYTLKSFLPSVKDPVNIGDSSGVYRLICGECGASYVGQTSRKLRIRCKEHLTRKDSEFFRHISKEKHIKGEHRVELLCRESDYFKVQKLEDIYIKLDRSKGSNINIKTDGNRSVLADNTATSLLASSSPPTSGTLVSLLT